MWFPPMQLTLSWYCECPRFYSEFVVSAWIINGCRPQQMKSTKNWKTTRRILSENDQEIQQLCVKKEQPVHYMWRLKYKRELGLRAWDRLLLIDLWNFPTRALTPWQKIAWNSNWAVGTFAHIAYSFPRSRKAGDMVSDSGILPIGLWFLLAFLAM